MKTHLKINSPPHQPNPNTANNSTTRFAVAVFLTLSSAIALPSCGGSQLTSSAPGGAASSTSRENQVAASAPPPLPVLPARPPVTASKPRGHKK